MNRDTYRLPTCDGEPLGSDAPTGVRGRFCSAKCDAKFDHLKADARDAQRNPELR